MLGLTITLVILAVLNFIMLTAIHGTLTVIRDRLTTLLREDTLFAPWRKKGM